MRIVVLAGGIGGARFLRGLMSAAPDADITVIGNTGDDIHLFGLKVCPDLDTVMYTLGGGIHEEQGWGRADETFTVKEELAAYGVGPEWFGLGDRDFATHIVRTQMMGAGYPLSAVTEALCARWQPGVRLLPMTDDRVETHVLIDDPGGEGRKAVHFQEYWVRLRASVPAHAVVPVGADQAKPAPGVLEAIADADVVLFPPSNPVVSVGTILAVPGVREAIADAGVPVVGLSPIVGDAPVRGMADKVLAAVGVESTAAAVAKHYGSGLLDGWLVDTVDAGAVEEVEAAGIRCRAIPLMMADLKATAAMA
ncbi:2-phospho-L-lactate transferase, partial [Streptomyces sp. MK37H]|uniref:2-phospho-L-lactate transferase n=1 Tax=Streptomyces sp. MK37H TaxID=2699117 RepID=UPI001B35EF23